MVNSASMSTERAIPDLWDVFGSKGMLPIRRSSWSKMQAQLSEEERAVNELFSDLHIHAGDLGDHDPPPSSGSRKNSSSQRNSKMDEQHNERNSNHHWDHIEKHLSMKKTIRKKMMRDLQQAFIDGQDPEACQEWDNRHVQLDPHKAGVEPNLLDMLKDNKRSEPASGPSTQQSSSSSTSAAMANSTTSTSGKKPGFWKKLTSGNKKSKR